MRRAINPCIRTFPIFWPKKTGHEYAYLSGLFSSVEGLTIEKYIIAQKVETVKELLTYNELSLADIAYRLGYSSVQHLSNQFRQLTGQTPGAFRQQRGTRQRQDLDKVKP